MGKIIEIIQLFYTIYMKCVDFKLKYLQLKFSKLIKSTFRVKVIKFVIMFYCLLSEVGSDYPQSSASTCHQIKLANGCYNCCNKNVSKDNVSGFTT